MDVIIVNEMFHCHSRYRDKIISFIYLYKSLFLVVGGYLAAKTRHVHIPALNDSKYIVWSIYIVVLTSLFTVIVMISLRNLRTYVAICLVVVIMASSILCLIFLPKVRLMKKEVSHSTNCFRSFVSNIPREDRGTSSPRISSSMCQERDGWSSKPTTSRNTDTHNCTIENSKLN